jgi:hypothetical protein
LRLFEYQARKSKRSVLVNYLPLRSVLALDPAEALDKVMTGNLGGGR